MIYICWQQDNFQKLIHLQSRLGNCEIIPYKSSIWFINRENKYWYFELEEGGTLWWRYHFFIPFFDMFSMSPDDFKSVLSSWVEEVLNCKVVTTDYLRGQIPKQVEEVLNCKVVTTSLYSHSRNNAVEEVLNCKVVTTSLYSYSRNNAVEEVLNCKVVTSGGVETSLHWSVEEILNQ